MNIYGVFYYYTDKPSHPDVLSDYKGLYINKDDAQKFSDENNKKCEGSTVRFYVKELRVV